MQNLQIFIKTNVFPLVNVSFHEASPVNDPVYKGITLPYKHGDPNIGLVNYSEKTYSNGTSKALK